MDTSPKPYATTKGKYLDVLLKGSAYHKEMHILDIQYVTVKS